MDKITEELNLFENLNLQVKDILECRVENCLHEISVTPLCELPTEPCTIEEFTKNTEETVQKAMQQLSK